MGGADICGYFSETIWMTVLSVGGARDFSYCAQLQTANVRLAAVGLEELGVEEFVAGKFLTAGELYIVDDKKTYTDLGFKRFSLLSIVTALFAKVARDAISKSKALGLGGDMKGDGLQNGGLLIVEKGGKVLYNFQQENPADHVPNEKILEVLGITDKPAPSGTSGKDDIECTDVCSLPPSK